MEQAAQPPRRRPKLVWAIFLCTILSTGLVALSFALVLSGAIPLGPEEEEYFRNLTPTDYAFTVFNGSLNLVAAIALFRLKGIAVYLYAAALVFGVLYTLVLAATTNFTMALGGGSGMGGMLMGFVVWAAVCAYAWRLKVRGVLA
jgi:hypothetical protein